MKLLRSIVLGGAIASMGLASPQCTTIDRTLSTRAGGFFDAELVGRYPDTDLEIVITRPGVLQMVDASKPDSRMLFEIFSTEIDGRRYLNWPINRPYECVGCDLDELAEALKEPEAVYAVRYATDVESLAGPALRSQYSIAELERREGEWVAYAWMDPNFSAQAVAMGLIEGECDGPCDTRPGALVRLKGSRRSLRDFVADHTDQLYREWIIVWRAQEDESTR